MADFSWTAPGGGDWTVPGDWTPAGVPTILDTVDFATGANLYTVTGDGSAASLMVDGDQVTFEGMITAGTLGQSDAGLVAIDGGSVTIDQTASAIVSSIAFDPGTFLQVNGLLADLGGGTADAVLAYGADADLIFGSSVTLNDLYIHQGATVSGGVALQDGGVVSLDTSVLFSNGTLATTGSGTLIVMNAVPQEATTYSFSEAVALGAGSLTIASDAGVALSLAGPISGIGGLDITSGDVSLAGPNTYAGGTSVEGAALTLTGVGAAGTGAVLLDNASLTTLADASGNAGAETVIGSGGADSVTAAAGNLLVFANKALTLDFQGGAQASTVVGGTGVLTAIGGAAGDELFGGTSGDDHLVAGTGATTLVGAGGTLTALGSAGDLLVASGGNTTLNGGDSHGNDTYFASGSGTTVVETGTGTSTIVANGANTSIYGGLGTENVFLSGGMSQLDFVDGFNGGTMNVVGFGAGDSLHVFDYAGNEVQAALDSAVVNSGNTILTLTDNTHIVLFGFTGISASNFV